MTIETMSEVSWVCICVSPETYEICGVNTDVCKGIVDHFTLVNHLQIPLHKAKNTLQFFMQWNVHTVLHPTWSSSFHKSDRMLCCCRMPCDIVGNTIFCPKEPSSWCYMIAQILTVIYSGAQATPWHEQAKIIRPVVSFLLGKVPQQIHHDGT